MSENIITIHQIVENLRGMPKKFEAHNELGHLLVLDIENLADRIEAAYKRLNTKPAENVNSEKVIYNSAKMRETDDWLNQLVSLINGEISHYMSQGIDCFSVDCGSWHIQYDKTKGGVNESV